MKKLSVLLIVSLIAFDLLSATRPGFYILKLVAVDRNIKIGEGKVENSKSENGFGISTYMDDLVSITWIPQPVRLCLSLKNNTDSTITLDWNNVEFIDFDGKSEKVIKSGEEHDKTYIYMNSKIKEDFTTESNKFYSNIFHKWSYHDLINDLHYNDAESKIIRIHLPFSFEGKSFKYIFSFEVSYFHLKVKTELVDWWENYVSIKSK